MKRISCLSIVFSVFAASVMCISPVTAQTAKPEVEVYIFLRSDCPISNRYAPAIQHLQQEFAGRRVNFGLIYPGDDETDAQVRQNMREYGYTIPMVRDTDHALARSSRATITPEAAVFDRSKLIYHGRIDDQVAAFGKVRAAATTHELHDAITAALAGHKPAVEYAPAVGCAMAAAQ